MKALSLFAGVEGLGLAAERAGFKVVAHCEIDKQARSVCRRRFPHARSYTDVRTLTGDQLRADDAVPDLVLGGFPCQDLSVAGRRAGLGGGRSGLFFEVARILAETHAEWFVLENVPGLLSSVCPCPGDGACERRAFSEYREALDECPAKLHPVDGGACIGGCMAVHGGAMGAVVGTLGELGYGVAYRVLDAQFLGVPQRRRRVFLVGRLGDWAAPAEVLLEPEGREGDLASRGTPRPRTARAAEVGARSGRSADLSATVTAKWAKGTGGPSGDECQNLIASTLQGGGVAATGSTPSRQQAATSSRPRPVSALTANGVGTCGADDNQAQAGHLLVMPDLSPPPVALEPCREH